MNSVLHYRYLGFSLTMVMRFFTAIFFLMLLTSIFFAQDQILSMQKSTGDIQVETSKDGSEGEYRKARWQRFFDDEKTNAFDPNLLKDKKIANFSSSSFASPYKKTSSIGENVNSEQGLSKTIFKRKSFYALNSRRFFSSAKTANAANFLKPEPLIAEPFDKKTDGELPVADTGFNWKSAFKQSLLFLSIQHGYALTQPKTREALQGNFLKDYASSVKSLHGWEDGGRFFTNYIAHPMQGSFMGFIQIQNDPKGIKQRFGASGDYWRSRMKAMAWSAAWSTQFEIGPLSQASIGNVGLKGKQTWIDIVITPTVGTAFLITEDAIDRFVIERIERMSDNYYVMAFARMLLNPSRTMANIIRFKFPWYRDRKRIH